MQDPWERNEPGLGLSRDPSRTPFQWDTSPNAGFTTGSPWLPLDGEWLQCNVERLRSNPTSLLSLYRELIALHRRYSALSIGAFRLVSADTDILVYERRHEEQRLLVALNFSSEERRVSAPAETIKEILMSSHLDRTGAATELKLRPNEGVIARTTDAR